MASIIWYLNRFLTSWREAVNKRLPKRSKASDGTVGDTRHKAGYSEHNRDRDGSVDAFDMDANVLGSSDPTGTPEEREIIEALKRDFQKLPGAQLWIHRGEIANRDIDNWRPRKYSGANKHDKHIHWQSRSSMEKVAMKPGALNRTDDVVDAINSPRRLVAHHTSTIPPWPHAPGRSFSLDNTDPAYYRTVEVAQRRLHERGWRITIDGHFGPDTARVIAAFQQEKRLRVDGKLGPKTWAAMWGRKISA